MKTKNFLILSIVVMLFSGCIVYSFYPLYTKKDLFPNELLTGEWYEGNDQPVKWNNLEAGWKFEHPLIGKKGNKQIDSTAYRLTICDKDSIVSIFNVHIIKLNGYYFLDFYLEDIFDGQEIDLANFHIIPVHTFAKLTIEKDKLIINWFDQDWLEDLIKENKIRIHHEYNDDFILLTAKPDELQKFVTKYVNSEDAFKDGMKVVLTKKTGDK